MSSYILLFDHFMKVNIFYLIFQEHKLLTLVLVNSNFSFDVNNGFMWHI